ncbi:MAG: serine acetyltransferase [Flavobacteriales bacterium]|nr:serine acetyltransferase [Flavobacteriales bacterium]
MIRSKADLTAYLEADRINLRRDRKRPHPYDEVWKFQRIYRRTEYWYNVGRHRGPLGWFLWKYWSWRLHRQSVVCCFEIPLNVFGPGLSISHRGAIIVHERVRVGKNCRLNVNVTIGGKPGPPPDLVPVIGDNVYIAAGARIFGGIELGDDLVIGANAVVNRSFPEGRMTIAGMPARKVSDTPSTEFIISTRTWKPA